MSPVHALVVLVAAMGGEPAGEVLDFTATYCPPCRQMKPLVARLEREGLPIRQVDVQVERALAEQYHVDSIPTFILVINGREVARQVGLMSESDLRRMCARIPQPAAEPEVLLAENTPQSRAEAAQSVELVQSAEQPKSNPILDLFRGRRGKEQTARGNDDALAAAAAVQVTTDDPMAASVRIRASINGQISLGSGTIVHSQPGRTLIITCGHIFRDHNESTKVKVDLFEGGKAETYVATIIDTDLQADVGLISIPTHSVVSSTPPAAPDLQLATGEPVVCIGCSAGKDPTLEKLQVTAVNKYDGPDNIECTGTPVQGRSGGGLFNADRQLVGVCIAAVTDAPLGVYAHAFAVHALLDRNGLSNLYQPSAPPETVLAVEESSGDAPAADFPTQPAAEIATADTAALAAEPPNAPAAGDPAADLASAMADVSAGDAEVVVIIRSRNNPNAESRIVIINRASPKFLAYLNGEIRPEGLAARRPAPADRFDSPRPREEKLQTARGSASVEANVQPVSFQPPRNVTPPRRSDSRAPRTMADSQPSRF